MLSDANCVDLVATMRELIDAMNRQVAMESAATPVQPPPQPTLAPCRCHDHSAQHVAQASGTCAPMDQSVALQYGHSAARWNEMMAQSSIASTNAFLERQQDRWQLMFKQLKTATE